MLAWLSQNIGTIIICVILIAVFALLIRSLVRDKKKGKSLCGGNCGSCAMGCHAHTAPAEATPSEVGGQDTDTVPQKEVS